MDTNRQFKEIVASCREIFSKKLHDYGASWRIMRPSSVTDQIFIKAKRIRGLEENGGHGMVAEGVEPEYRAIVNYCLVAIIQLRHGWVDAPDVTPEQALALYDETAEEAFRLMTAKNHDYGEAWRDMRLTSLTDMIMTKLQRTKEIENIGGKTLVSEGADANYLDMMIYAVFALIRLDA